jgi:hypothetical protein
LLRTLAMGPLLSEAQGLGLSINRPVAILLKFQISLFVGRCLSIVLLFFGRFSCQTCRDLVDVVLALEVIAKRGAMIGIRSTRSPKLF